MKSQKTVLSVSYRRKRKAQKKGLSIHVARNQYLKEEERLFLLEDIQERSIYELRDRQEEEMTQQEVALYYSFLSQIEDEIQKQQNLVSKVREELEQFEGSALPAQYYQRGYRYRT